MHLPAEQQRKGTLLGDIVISWTLKPLGTTLNPTCEDQGHLEPDPLLYSIFLLAPEMHADKMRCVMFCSLQV